MEYIRSDQLEVPRDQYQKPLNKSRVAKIVAEFDEKVVNEPKVSYRDGHYYLFDGQHTVASFVAQNNGEPVMIRCKVYRGLTAQQEAMLFAIQTGYAAKPTPGNCLRARLFAGDPEAIAFRDATEEVGFILDIEGARGEYHIGCINTALRMYRKLKPKQYNEALCVLYAAWNGIPDSLLDQILIAVCEFVRKYNGHYNRDVLIRGLSSVNPRVLYEYIMSDFTHPGYRRNINAIYEIYNRTCGPKKLAMLF